MKVGISTIHSYGLIMYSLKQMCRLTDRYIYINRVVRSGMSALELENRDVHESNKLIDGQLVHLG
jgi:hypothetical protein